MPVGAIRSRPRIEYLLKSRTIEGDSPVISELYGRWVGRLIVCIVEVHLHPRIQARIIDSEQSTVRESTWRDLRVYCLKFDCPGTQGVSKRRLVTFCIMGQ